MLGLFYSALKVKLVNTYKKIDHNPEHYNKFHKREYRILCVPLSFLSGRDCTLYVSGTLRNISEVFINLLYSVCPPKLSDQFLPLLKSWTCSNNFRAVIRLLIPLNLRATLIRD
jgi:hypothetical protein